MDNHNTNGKWAMVILIYIYKYINRIKYEELK